MRLFLCGFFIVFLLACSVQVNGQKMERIEPPFWWADMEDHRFQLLVYGEGIGNTTPKIKSRRVRIRKLERPANKNYLLIYLDLKKAKPGTFTIRFKNREGGVLEHNYLLKERKKASAARTGFDNSDVIYLIMPDRFANGDPSNDSHPEVHEKVNRTEQGGRHGGDIQGVIDHLDYVKDLGATALWSTPMLEDNMPKGSYHTYAITDFYKIDPRYGTNEDYRHLADELHQRDMKLIMDVVPNHCGSAHWWMDDLPYEDWVHQFPEYQRSNFRLTTQFDPYRSEKDAIQCMDGWFDITMPDLNQSNPHLVSYLAQNAIWWIEYADLDGLRVDTYSYNDKNGIARWTKRILKEYPNFNIMGEVWFHDQAQTAYWQGGSKVAGSYDSGLPTVMDFTLYDAIIQAFNEDRQNWSDGLFKIYENFVNDYLYSDPYKMLVFGENHDTHRMHHLFNGDINKYKLALTLLLTTRGIPQIYYGSEIGMSGNKDKGDGDLRRDFPGGWPGDEVNAFEKEGRNARQNEIFDFTKKLLQWRKEKSVIHTGKLQHFVPQDNVYVYFRYSLNEAVMVVLNNNPEEQTLDLERFNERLLKFNSGREIISGEEMALRESLKIPGKTAFVFELR